MSNKFDELAKGLAQSVTRRQALKRFGVGLGGMALACFGLARPSVAQGTHNGRCQVNLTYPGTLVYTGHCVDPNSCLGGPSSDCPAGETAHKGSWACGNLIAVSNRPCTF